MAVTPTSVPIELKGWIAFIPDTIDDRSQEQIVELGAISLGEVEVPMVAKIEFTRPDKA